MAYVIANNPLLIGVSTGQDLTAHQRVAEVLLGFSAVAELVDATQHAQAEDAIAMQVSYQVECGIEAFVLQEVLRGHRRKRYRGGTHRMAPVHPMARKVASTLLIATTTVVPR